MGLRHLRQGQEDGVLRDDEPAPFLWATIIGLGLGWSQLRRRLPGLLESAAADQDLDEAYLSAALAILLEGVRADTA